jgi:hypothetical protein
MLLVLAGIYLGVKTALGTCVINQVDNVVVLVENEAVRQKLRVNDVFSRLESVFGGFFFR